MTASDKGPGGTGAGGDAAKVTRPIATGPEMASLGRFYRDVTWKGVIHAGGMGPGTPAMTGWATARPTLSRTGAGSSWTASRTSSSTMAPSC